VRQAGWSAVAAALFAALCLWPGFAGTPVSGSADAAPRSAAPAPDLLEAIIAKRYRAPVDTLVDREAADLGQYEVSRKLLNGQEILLTYTDRRFWPQAYDPNWGEISLGVVVPWPANDGRACHGALLVDGATLALGANGYDEWVSGRGLLGTKTRFVTHSFKAPFSESDEANTRIQVVGRRAEAGKLRSLPACPDTTEIRRADINAVDWRIHFQTYPQSGAGAAIPDCIRSQLDRLGAPASGRRADGTQIERTLSPLSWRGRKVIEACRRWHLRRTDFACEIKREMTRCEDQWRRTNEEVLPLDLQAMTDHLTSGPKATVLWIQAENPPALAQRREREARWERERQQEAERRAAEAEARRRWEASPEGRAALAAKAERERQAEAQRARDFPYYVVIRCGDISHIAVTLCLRDDVDTTLRLRNGGNETLYNLSRILGLRPGWETQDGYRIDLRASYALSIQNASSQIMGVRVYERRTGRQVFAREVGRYGTIVTAR
jgi:hypothetical protein